MAHIISVLNQKGGVGKTTTCINLGYGLIKFKHRKRCLLIDADPQANLTRSLNIKANNNTLYEAMRGFTKLTPIKVIQGLHIIPASLDLSSLEIELVSEAGREQVLKSLLKPLKNKYDVILIDCTPSFGLLTLNALTASDCVITPFQTQYLATQGLTKLNEVIDKVRLRLNKKLKTLGILFTQYNKRRVLDNEVVSAVKAKYKNKVFKTIIHSNVSLAEAPSLGLDIYRYKASSTGAKDYQKLSKEVNLLIN